MTKKQYQRRFHQPLFPLADLKTTTPEGKREYQKFYMRRVADMKRNAKKVTG